MVSYIHSMKYPDPGHKTDEIDELHYFDHGSLCLLIESLPDPVVARMTNLADSRVRSNIFGAIPVERSKSVQESISIQGKDPDKDQITRMAVKKTVEKLMGERKIKREDDYYVTPD